MTLAEEFRGMLAKAPAISPRLSSCGGPEIMTPRYHVLIYAAEALLLTIGKTFSSHRAVIAAFGEYFLNSGVLSKEMHHSLHRALEKRQLSDNDFFTGISETDVTDLREKTEKFLYETENYIHKKINK